MERDPDKQAPAAPPSLRKPGETLPTDDASSQPGQKNVGVMRPVQFPKQKPDDAARRQSRQRARSAARRLDARPSTPATPTPGTQPTTAACSTGRRRHAGELVAAGVATGSRSRRTEPTRASCKLEAASPAPSRQFHCDERQQTTAPLKPRADQFARVCRDTP